MKLSSLLLFFFLFTLTLSEYPPRKYRNPSVYPKPPPYQQISKKWQQHPPRPPMRSRPPQSHHYQKRQPIPVHMPNHHKIQMGAASINRPVAVPVRAFWKNTQTTFRPPIVTSAPVLPKKIFQSSPAILAQEYDFQVQSNNIPTPIKTIKQIGEKGPIHTIPAPNLSIADKPAIIEEVKPKTQQVQIQEKVQNQIPRQQDVTTFVQIQPSHQYQVTEIPELNKIQIYDPNLQPNEIYQLVNSYQAIPQDFLQLQNYVDNQEQFAMDKSSDSKNFEPEVTAESINHSQFVQNYFEPRENTKNEENTTSGYYVSLPSKEAAEQLATLQAAGQLNSNLMQRTKNGQDLPVSIFVTDDGEAEGDDESQSDEDYQQDDLMTEEMKQSDFGHKIQTKN